MNASHLLPSRDLAFAVYPQRDGTAAQPLHDALLALRAWLPGTRPARLPSALLHALQSARQRFTDAPPAALVAALPPLRAQLRQHGLHGAAAGEALALVAEAASRSLGKTPYPTQLLAAWLLLDGRLIEMATGEGKTLAAALAAATAALAGVAVHVLTANDYLVQRDCDALAPLYAGLGLSVARVLPAMSRAERERAYRSDIVYSTAKELAFDYLRDHLLLRGERDPRVLLARAFEAAAGDAVATPLLPGLCFGVVDEADSILLDEATMPLILSAPSAPVDAAAYRRAFDIARTLRRGRDYRLAAEHGRVALEPAGRARIDAALACAGHAVGSLAPPRRAHELVESALAARLLFRRDRDYALDAGKLKLIDQVTGRLAVGRQWSAPLQQMIELKEGLAPSPPTAPAAQITYQRLFPRYLRLAGMSGTLHESRHELHSVYRSAVLRLPLAEPNRRRWLGERMFVDAKAKSRALIERVAELLRRGRPVLIGTDSVAASAELSAQLNAAGIEHQLLNALQDADEAGHIARAGCAGVVTVATNIAGRGTDIRLDAEAAAAGGLHVIAAMRNRSRRIDRQLIGRSARHGDPGSAERLLALDDTLIAAAWPARLRGAAAACARDGELPLLLARPLAALAQRLAEWRERSLRRQLRRAGRAGDELFAFAGRTE